MKKHGEGTLKKRKPVLDENKLNLSMSDYRMSLKIWLFALS